MVATLLPKRVPTLKIDHRSAQDFRATLAGDKPAFVCYGSEGDYRDHYIREYCQQEIYTSDQIRVHFSPNAFKHAFYEGSDKTRFAENRAKRIDWIRTTLASPDAHHYIGWDNQTCSERYDRRVELYKDFVVVLALKLDKQQLLKAEFLTCFPASSKTREKISGRSSSWRKDLAIDFLRERRKKKRRKR